MQATLQLSRERESSFEPPPTQATEQRTYSDSNTYVLTSIRTALEQVRTYN